MITCEMVINKENLCSCCGVITRFSLVYKFVKKQNKHLYHNKIVMCEDCSAGFSGMHMKVMEHGIAHKCNLFNNEITEIK